jgi:type IV pilus assembly protein PilW
MSAEQAASVSGIAGLPEPKRQGGMSLIELMVAVTIALVMSLAIFSTLAGSEGRRRTMTATNDIGQVGSFAAYQLDKLLRSAGSGISQSYLLTTDRSKLAPDGFGCALKAQVNGTVILPNASVPAPFTSLNTTIVGGNYRLAPMLIAQDATSPNVSGQKSDALIIMSGSSGYGEVPTSLRGKPTATNMVLDNTISFRPTDTTISPRPNDLVLIIGKADATTGAKPCMIQQVSYLDQTTLKFASAGAGKFYGSPIGSTALTDYQDSDIAINLGSAAATNPPTFTLLGVGDSNTLKSYDLLQMGGVTSPQDIADGIFEMHALYNIDSDAATDSFHKADLWVTPTAGYSIATLSDGSAASAQKIQGIKAIRVGLILRTSLAEKTPPTAGPLKLFADLNSTPAFSRTLSSAEQNYRYRTIELTIPLRNALYSN